MLLCNLAIQKQITEKIFKTTGRLVKFRIIFYKYFNSSDNFNRSTRMNLPFHQENYF
jgi:hypothetical protein